MGKKKRSKTKAARGRTPGQRERPPKQKDRARRVRRRSSLKTETLTRSAPGRESTLVSRSSAAAVVPSDAARLVKAQSERDSTRPAPVARQPMQIAEAALIRHVDAFSGFRYHIDNARYPYPLPGVKVPLAPPYVNNCCTFVEALTVRAWAEEYPDLSWSTRRHRQMMIIGNDDMFSPVTALVEAGIATAVDSDDGAPTCWTVVQGWRQQWRGGHTLIIVAHHVATDRLLTLESNSAYKLDGVGFRSIGNLAALGGRPPVHWWDLPNLWTWQRFCNFYALRRQGQLNVQPGDWCITE